ncbi:phosphatase inhibitor-domain-containing protein [Cokeromyces recurvatus]|uniref:phosphatase inhibitor-domain-containing protein n=1 Tax=Cokeromyces recurvatus TaxID=90255 RepID=UPI0022207A59|nr:phosphatase inhibitor-domain-containing protein [Cokeromyces recurvatus]KAI7905207.1 phosphatase inhibitor-domain-containing protein [Cokeromyces recurvatus]
MANTTHPRTFTRMREETPTTGHGSRTLTVNETDIQSPSEESMNTSDEGEEVGVLRLTGDMNARGRRVIQWDESVIDNEHLNKKKSKICCIYHKPHAVGESSDESSSSSSSSDSDSDSSSNSENDRPNRLSHRNCNHNHEQKKKKKRRNPREVSPNAYERQPVYNKGHSKSSS